MLAALSPQAAAMLRGLTPRCCHHSFSLAAWGRRRGEWRTTRAANSSLTLSARPRNCAWPEHHLLAKSRSLERCVSGICEVLSLPSRCAHHRDLRHLRLPGSPCPAYSRRRALHQAFPCSRLSSLNAPHLSKSLPATATILDPANHQGV
jgi:hypothetical protein